MWKVFCFVCNVHCSTPRSLCDHMRGRKHITLLKQAGAVNMELLGRMQYILDTYLTGYPVLGLEYVVEEEVDCTYSYTCTLCSAVEHDWRMMIGHVTEPEHNQNYIHRHHRIMLAGKKNMVLARTIIQLYSKFGRKEIRIKKPDDPILSAAAGPSSSEDAQKNGHLPPAGDHLDKAQQEAVYVESTDVLQLKTLKNFCNVCNICCSNPMVMGNHILGYKHKQNLEASAPHKVESLHRLSYFLSEHMADEPVLGLEYVVEEKKGEKWKFFCQLCDQAQLSLHEIIKHINFVEHTMKYIRKHHQDLLPPILSSHNRKKVTMHFLRPMLLRIVEKHGRKNIQVRIACADNDVAVLEDNPGTAPEVSREGDVQPSKYNGGKSSHLKRSPSPHWEEKESHDGYKKALKKFTVDDPPLAKRGRLCHEEDREASPSILHTPTPRDLHQTEGQATPEVTATVLCPEEDLKASSSRPHTPKPRDLHQTEGQATPEVTATVLCPEEDLEASPSRPHTPKPVDSRQTERCTTMGATTAMLFFEENREASTSRPHTSKPMDSRHTKSYTTMDATTAVPFLEEDRKASTSIPHTMKPMDSNQTERYTTMDATTTMLCLEEDWNISTSRPHTSKPRDSHQTKSQSALEAATAMQDLEFHTNNQLLEYLANFQINNYQDAAFIHKITQNLFKALTRFQKEESERLEITSQHETPSVSASRTVPETPEVSVHKARSPSPKPETTLPIKTADSSSKPQPTNDITKFYDSFKNMDESQVVGIFQRIAATNPEFQEMDIPAVIRFLKHSGRLKKT